MAGSWRYLGRSLGLEGRYGIAAAIVLEPDEFGSRNETIIGPSPLLSTSSERSADWDVV
jgi:hypothetical protein